MTRVTAQPQKLASTASVHSTRKGLTYLVGTTVSSLTTTPTATTAASTGPTSSVASGLIVAGFIVVAAVHPIVVALEGAAARKWGLHRHLTVKL